MPAERGTRTGGSGPTVEDRPSRDEVQRRINSLYDRAETATGTYNATRAMSGKPRKRVESRPSASRPSDPAVEAVTRQLFDRARTQLGPTVPAALPPGRAQARPAESRPERSERPERRPEPEGAGRALEAQSGRAMAELTMGTTTAPQLTPSAPESAPAPIAALPPAAPQAQQSPMTAQMPQLAQMTQTQVPQAQAPQPPQMSQLAQMAQMAQAQMAQTPTATVLDLPPVPPAPAVEMPASRVMAPQQFATAPAAAFDPLTASLDLLPSIGSPRTEATPTGATWPPPETAWSTPEAALSTGQMPVVTQQQPWSTGQMPVVTEQQPWATGQMPVVAEQQTWSTGQFPAVTEQQLWSTGQMPVVAEQPVWSTGQIPLIPQQPSPQPAWQPAPEPSWRPPEQQWQPTAPAPEVSFAAAPSVAPTLAPPAPEVTLPPVQAPAPVAVIPAPAPTAPDAGTQSKTATALAFARAQIGRPCLWGAAGPDAYDCSSLTQAAWKAAGVLLPRTAQEQSGSGALVPLTDIRAGDLIFFYDSVDHVGLYTGNGLMIHAPSPGTPIREESIFYAGSAAIRGAVRPA
ncbi:NlpC/P60 family protein [Streptomyces sp. NPDC091280]|uniref:C40 family peptidase n=1 Tax=Streptomyces sp. NPDC091280 TaxID=3365984 RepID=UPI00382E35D7